MTLNFTGILLALFGLSLILITLSLYLQRGSPAGAGCSAPAKFFLVVLRLAIGWHCLVEGIEKYNAPNWSSEAYLREAMGPLADPFRQLAGDRLIDRLTVGADGNFPAELDRDWRRYINAFTDFFALTNEQGEKVQAILVQQEKDTVASFNKAESVTKISRYPPDLKVDWTVKQRLEEYELLLDHVRSVESEFPTGDKNVHTEWKNSKADLAKWRAELKKTVDAETAKLKKALNEVLTSEQKQQGVMPPPGREPMASWRMLEWSDAAVQWSLIVLGACLILGLLSRISCFALALLVLSFYAAMPPLPGWPESPRLEGHYLLINKTLIEVIALLALACLPTGRWAGLDGLLGLCCCGKRATPTQPSHVKL